MAWCAQVLLFCAVARFFRPAYKANLMQQWISALDGVVGILEHGAKATDIGCGHGYSTALMVETFPNSKFIGYDFPDDSITSVCSNTRNSNVKFGLRYCNTGPYVDPAKAVELVQAGEDAGFDSAWTVEHTVVPAGYSSPYPYSADGKMAGGNDAVALPDPLIWMTYVASQTSKIKLASGIIILPQHNPVILAKQIATLDHLSNGRVIFGIGVGWLKEEFDAIGVPFEARGKRTDEYVAAMRCLWSQDKPSFNGEFVSFQEAYCRPQPVQRNIPVIVGGHSKAAARRAGRLGDGYFPAREAPQEMISIARQTAIEHNRDPELLEITVSMPEDAAMLDDYAALGVHRVLVPVTPLTGLNSGINNPDDVRAWKTIIDKYAN